MEADHDNHQSDARRQPVADYGGESSHSYQGHPCSTGTTPIRARPPTIPFSDDLIGERSRLRRLGQSTPWIWLVVGPQRGDLRTSVYCTINVSEDAWVAEPEIAVTVRV
jgi:hypothetical protein